MLKAYTVSIVTDFFGSYEGLPVKQQHRLMHLIIDLNDELYKNLPNPEYMESVIGFARLLKDIVLTTDKHGLNPRSRNNSWQTAAFYQRWVETANKSELAVKCAIG